MSYNLKEQKAFYTIYESNDGTIKIEIDPVLVVKYWGLKGYRIIMTGQNYIIVKITRNTIVTKVKEISLRHQLRDYCMYQEDEDALRMILSKDFVVKNLIENLETIEISFRYGDETTALFFYKNGIVRLIKNNIELINYEDYDGYIWDSQIIQRNIKNFEYKNAEFLTFLLRVSGNDEKRCKSILSILGYLLHSYKDPTVSKAIILMDEEIDPDDNSANGGTGKTMIGVALSKIVYVSFFNGKNLKTTDKFFFSGVKPETKILFFDDTTKYFDFESLYPMITGNMEVERKYENRVDIEYQDSPKILISSNYGIKGTGGNAEERRKIEFELSSYFKDVKTPMEEFGHRLFDDWPEEEWLRFDNMMIFATQLYLEQGILVPEPINAKMNRLISDTSREFIEFMDEVKNNLPTYQGEVRGNDVRFNKATLFDLFLEKNPSQNNRLSITKLKKWIDLYCAFYNIKSNHTKSNGSVFVVLYNIIKPSENDDIS